VLYETARRENMTLRDLYNLTAAARGHWVLCGSTKRIADTLEEWFAEEAADGFNVLPPHFPGALADFVNLVVPELQARGLFRREYEGTTLRDHFGCRACRRPGCPRELSAETPEERRGAVALQGSRRPHRRMVAERHRRSGPARRRLGEADHRGEMPQPPDRRFARQAADREP